MAKSPSKHHKNKADRLYLEGVDTEGLSLRNFDAAVSERFGVVCGIDEAGRGPLAGPVFAAAVILDPLNPIEGLNDSKKLTEKKREKLFDEIIAKAKAYCIASSGVEEIENTDILSADMEAMKRAYEGLGAEAGIVIVDGDVLPAISANAKTLTKGDATSEAVAAASVLAKVSRDRFMCEQAELYPEYGFEKHKGYGTAAHYSAVDKFGLCPIHRKSFFKKYFEKKHGQED